jgi:hypothetical protein
MVILSLLTAEKAKTHRGDEQIIVIDLPQFIVPVFELVPQAVV